MTDKTTRWVGPSMASVGIVNLDELNAWIKAQEQIKQDQFHTTLKDNLPLCQVSKKEHLTY